MSTSLWPSAATPASEFLADAPHWYALCTCSRHEKRVATVLEQRSVEFFLPLYASVRRWKDRRVELQLPLFPGYVFVRFNWRRRLDVLTSPGAVRFVTFGGQPAMLRDVDLQCLRTGLSTGISARPHPYLKAGQRVHVRSGPLTGLEGVLIRKKDAFRLVLSIDIIMRSIVVEVDECDVVPVS